MRKTTMTPEQFQAWRARHFPKSRRACAKALGLAETTILACETGRTRNGNPYDIPLTVELACAAWTMGLRDYDGGAVAIG